MHIGEKRVDNETWQALAEVNTGDSFLLQNISVSPVRYCVLDSVPEETVNGGVILPYQQLAFKKVGGDLYLKKDEADGYIEIEKVES